MEKWRLAWRQIQRLLPTIGLEALRDALLKDDYQLVPNGYFFLSDFDQRKITAACGMGYPVWKSGFKNFDEASEFLLKVRANTEYCDFVEWFDHTQRQEVLSGLLPEVSAELARRSLTLVCESSIDAPKELEVALT